MSLKLRKLLPIALSVLILASMAAVAQARADTATFQSWSFTPPGDVLATATIKDLSRDKVDDIIVAARDKSVYALDGATGARLWNFSADQYYLWKVLVTSPSVDANGNSNSDILTVSADRFAVMIDGAKGKQLWNFTTADTTYKQGTACSISVRSAHYISDIDSDGVPDAAIVAGTGDGCTKDKVTALALSGKTGKQIWEYSKQLDNHGFKDGVKGSEPVMILDLNKDGALDLAIVDEQSLLRVISGRDGSELLSKPLGVFGSVWGLVPITDVTGDGVPDAIGLEFIEGGGGPDYASIDALDLANPRAIWQVKLGDGRINGAAVYSAAAINGPGPVSGQAVQRVAVTSRMENALSLLLLDAKTGEQKWQYSMGEEKSRDDLNKIYPVARIATAGPVDEIAVGSIDSKLYLLNPADASVIWSYAVTGEVGGVTYVSSATGERDVIVQESYKGIRSLSRQTTIPTSLTIQQSAQTVVSGGKLVISGALNPSFPGELVEIRYVDPTGAVTTKPLVLSKEGTYTDVIEPGMVGTWRVNAAFAGQGIYIDSRSSTVSFTVLAEKEPAVYQLKAPGESASYPVVYDITGGQVNSMTIDKEAKAVKIAVKPNATGSLRIDLPRSVIDAFESKYRVTVDGKDAQFQEISADADTRSLLIPFNQDSQEITITGTYIVPEFPAVAPLLSAAALGAAVVAFRVRARLQK